MLSVQENIYNRWKAIVSKSFTCNEGQFYYQLTQKGINQDDMIDIVDGITQHKNSSFYSFEQGNGQVDKNSLHDGSCRLMVGEKWSKLHSLSLAYCKIGDNGCKYLSFGQWPQLQYLNLAENSIGNRGCYHLSKSQWKKLHTLYLGGNNIDARGCTHLSKAQWHTLSYLGLYDNMIGKQGFFFIKNRLWMIQCYWEFKQK